MADTAHASVGRWRSRSVRAVLAAPLLCPVQSASSSMHGPASEPAGPTPIRSIALPSCASLVRFLHGPCPMSVRSVRSTLYAAARCVSNTSDWKSRIHAPPFTKNFNGFSPRASPVRDVRRIRCGSAVDFLRRPTNRFAAAAGAIAFARIRRLPAGRLAGAQTAAAARRRRVRAPAKGARRRRRSPAPPGRGQAERGPALRQRRAKSRMLTCGEKARLPTPRGEGPSASRAKGDRDRSFSRAPNAPTSMPKHGARLSSVSHSREEPSRHARHERRGVGSDGALGQPVARPAFPASPPSSCPPYR